MTKHEIAARYHAAGFNVLPIGTDKRPIVKWDDWKTQRQTDRDVAAFDWESAHGVGVVIGAVSGNVVNIDIDNCHDPAVVQEVLDFLWLPLDYQWTVRTGNGFQIWVRCSDLKLEAGVVKAPYEGCDHIELRWNECYSVVPPSRHPSGKLYTFMHTTRVPDELPTEVAAEDLLIMAEWGARIDGAGIKRYDAPASEEVKDQIFSFRQSGDEAHLEAAMCGMEQTEQGERNATLYHLALAMAYDGVLERWLNRLVIAAERSGLRPREIDRSVLSARARAVRKAAKVEAPPEEEVRIEPEPTSEEMLQGVVSLKEALLRVAHYTTHPLPKGIEFPWKQINWKTRGLRPGWLCYMAGYTSMGKTAAAVETAVHAAGKGKRVLFISCEMSPEELAVRVAQRFGLSSRRFYGGAPINADTEAAEHAAEVAYHENVGIAYTRKMRDIRRLTQAFSPDLLVVDYLQFLELGRDSRLEGTTKNSHALKDLARHFEIPVLCLSQLRRPDPNAGYRCPGLEDLRDSGSIEQDADQVIFVHRERDPKERYALPEGKFVVAKARMGEQGDQDFVFEGITQTFRVITGEV